ncbi:hypothetical protein PFICI_01676 [Pestalotiopsis fici W106-1]|uniref:ATP phosphoribosyltransferase n=1 Tax=Pestalotiopsis fici (strain W106-1 / CGMCC3.15140) TaxID=1229662 RepID=W3XP62_PESFW|nr:uncharacterized protein PFICI_01676 [Pestalotiopsis fici W106-1]ETS87848.1 hypothetical protein PFICI_01676 [Pestalotiopsis fici W106-1]
MSSSPRFKLVFFVPTAAAEACKTAIFGAGAGRYPNYAEVCYSTAGTGQFRPVGNAKPHTGQLDKLEHTEELRIETLCPSEDIARKSVEALKK